MTKSFVSALVVLMALVVSSACGKSSSFTEPTPINPVVEKPSTFTFKTVSGGMEIPAQDLDLYVIRGDNTPAVVGQMVFGDNQAQLSNAGLGPLRGFSHASMVVAYPPEFKAHLAAIQEAGNEVASVARVPVVPQEGGNAPFSLRFDSKIGGAEFQMVLNEDWSIAGGAFVFKTKEFVNYRNLAHEMGHGLGLFHSEVCGVMSPNRCGAVDLTKLKFTQAEIDNFHLKQKLKSGTTFPVSAGASLFSRPEGPAARAPRYLTLVCEHIR